ncbi:MAG: nicotinate-nicotinamide nucleotide adenylyltransferase, partial [Actinomycetota bacterium]
RLRAVEVPELVVEPDPGTPRRIGLLPGSFDPITIAHVALAEAASRLVDVTVLVYSARTIAKEGEPPLLGEEQRVHQLHRVSEARPDVIVGLCSHGLLVDQVDAARARFPGTDLSLVIGSDKLIQLLDPVWYEDPDAALERLFRRAGVLYGVREGERDAVEQILANLPRWRERFVRLDVPSAIAAVSSRSVRARLRRGDDVANLLPPEARGMLGGRA